MRSTVLFVTAAAAVLLADQVNAQGRREVRRDRQEVARAQGVPPGQLPPPDECRVWYDNRPNGRQPGPTSCRQAEAIAARERNARVIYGEDVYRAGRSGYGGDVWRDDDRAVRRDGRVRDSRISGGVLDDRRTGAGYGRDAFGRNGVAFQNGYRDGMSKGREDGEDGDRYDVNRHGWYRSGERGYDDDFGSKAQYQARYREGFEAGYAEGYRIYARR